MRKTCTGTLPPRETKMKVVPLAMDIYVRYILDHVFLKLKYQDHSQSQF